MSIQPRRHLAAGAFVSLTAQLVTILSSGVTGVAIARLLGADDTGVYGLVMTLFAVITTVFLFSMQTGVTYVVAHGRWSTRRALRDCMLAAFALGALGATLTLAFYALWGDATLGGVTWSMAFLAVLALPSWLAWNLVAAIALGQDGYERYGVIQILQAVLTLVASVALAIRFGVVGAVGGLAISGTLTAFIAFVLTLRHSRSHAGRPSPQDVDGRAPGERSPLLQAWRFGLRTWPAEALQLLNYRLDLFILAAYVTDAELGRYYVAASLTSAAWLLPSALQTVLLPRSANLDAAVREGRLASEESDFAVAKGLRHTVLLLLPVTLLLVAALVVAIPLLYGPEFRGALVYALILLPGVVALGVAKVASAVIVGRGYPTYTVYNTIIVVPVTVMLYLALIPPLGAAGAALASSLSYLLTTVISVFFVRRATRIPLRAILCPTRCDVADYAEVLGRVRGLLAGDR